MTVPSPKERVRRRGDVRRQDVGADALLYDPRRERVHVLNPTSAFVWERLAGGPSALDLEAALREHFSVPEGVDVRGDVARLIEELRAADLVEPVEEGG